MVVWKVDGEHGATRGKREHLQSTTTSSVEFYSRFELKNTMGKIIALAAGV